MLLVIRLTMKKNNITKLLQHNSSQWLVRRSVLGKKHTHTLKPNIKDAMICKTKQKKQSYGVNFTEDLK